MESKIFINTDDEISFIAEKIKAAKEKRIALVIPDKALIFSSLATLKLLKKQIGKQDKELIIVTMDEAGKRLSERVNISTVGRVTELTPEIWDAIQKDVEPPVHHPQVNKESLLRKENHTEENVEPETIIDEVAAPVEPELPTPLPAVIAPEVIAPVVAETQLEEPEVDLVELAQAQEMKEEKTKEPIVEKEIIEKKEPVVENVKTTEPKAEPEIDFVVGKDINNEPPKSKIIKEETKRKSDEVVKEKIPLPQNKNYAKNKSNGASFEKFKLGFIAFFQKVKAKIQDLGKSEDGKANNKKWYIAGGVLAFFLIATTSYAYWLAPRVRIEVEAANENINVEQQLFVSSANKTITKNADKIFVPSYDLNSNPKSASQDAPATGTKMTGTKATGQIEITNNSTIKDIKIQKGVSIFTCKAGSCAGLKYVSTSNATIPKKVSTSPPSRATVTVEASDIGDKYNFAFPTTNLFDLSGAEIDTFNSSVGSFTGGTSKEIKVITQADVDNLKKLIEEQVKKHAIDDLKSSATSENILIESTIQTKISDEKLDIAVGQQADRFNLSLSITATAQGFKKSDLQSVTNELVGSKKLAGYEVDEKTVTFQPTIQDKVTEGQKVLLSIKAVQKPNLNQNDIKSSIKGKSISDTEKYINGLKGVKSTKVIFISDWIPGFLRHTPFNETDINLSINIK